MGCPTQSGYFAGLHTDDDAVGIDQHDIIIFADHHSTHQLSGLLELGLIVGQKSLAAANLNLIIFHSGPLSVAVSGHHQQFLSRFHQLHGYHFVVLFQIDGTDAAGNSAHRTHIIFGEADALAVFRHDDDIVSAGGLLDADEFIPILQIHGNQAGLPVCIKV